MKKKKSIQNTFDFHTENFLSVLKNYKKIERQKLKKSEIFRRIYSLPKLITKTMEEKNNKILSESDFISSEQIKAIEENWYRGLDNFDNEEYYNLLKNIEDYILSNKPLFFDDLSVFEGRSKKDEKIDQLQYELYELSQLDVKSPEIIEIEYEEAIDTIKNQYEMQSRFKRIFKGGSKTRYARFIKSKNKKDFLNKKEIEALNWLIVEFPDIDEIAMRDESIFTMTLKEFNERKSNLKKYKDQQIREYREWVKEIENIQREINKYEKTSV